MCVCAALWFVMTSLSWCEQRFLPLREETMRHLNNLQPHLALDPDWADPSCFLTSIVSLSLHLIPTPLYLLSLISLPPIPCSSHCVHVLDAHLYPPPSSSPFCLYLTSFAVIGQVSCVPSSLPLFLPLLSPSIPVSLPFSANGVIAAFLPLGAQGLRSPVRQHTHTRSQFATHTYARAHLQSWISLLMDI